MLPPAAAPLVSTPSVLFRVVAPFRMAVPFRVVASVTAKAPPILVALEVLPIEVVPEPEVLIFVAPVMLLVVPLRLLVVPLILLVAPMRVFAEMPA